jgi:hypothetical protein
MYAYFEGLNVTSQWVEAEDRVMILIQFLLLIELQFTLKFGLGERHLIHKV